MNRTSDILKEFEPISSGSILKSLNEHLDINGYENISVTDVEVGFDRDIAVTFSSLDEDDDLIVIFTFDEEDYPEAIVLDDEEEEGDEDDLTIIDLSTLSYSVMETAHGTYLNLINLGWMNKSTIDAILTAGDLIETANADEAMKTVIRGGKKVRIPLVRKKRRKILTPAQKRGIMKGKMKRKAKKSQTSRKLKRSLKIRKRSGVKKGNSPRGYKVQGTKGHL